MKYVSKDPKAPVTDLPALVLISIVIPVHNESHVIAETLKETLKAALGISQQYEILIIDDGSDDGTWETVRTLSQHNHHIKMIRFSRNFGKEAAILAGLKFSRGKAVVVMDGDLQHPPALLPKMVHLWRDEDYHVVHGVKTGRQKETAAKGLFAKLFYASMTLLSGYNLNQATDFKLLDRRVVDHYINLSEKVRFFRGLIPWLGFRNASVSFVPENRTMGTSKWSRLALMTLAVRAICSFSSLPMQVVTFMGGVMFTASILLGIQTLFMKLSGRAVEGFTTVILLLLFIGSILMISLGIIGQYLAMIYEEIKARPPFIIEKMENL
ncbi:MAG: glycosyltransferase family 2 protein [Deltaproteobacteria bacterium]|nr:glycosyltransferase family 2 protein [Deltaproteobacteria bacterium]